ncbi:MAG: hypothetical protein WA510_29180 [Acidobacteriaceae bacterium]
MSPARIPRLLLLLVLSACLPVLAQTPNQRLILKDGSYQVITKYQKVGDRVRYFSAERGQWEELPANLVDWTATQAWAAEHKPGAHPPAASPEPSPPEQPQSSPGAPSNPEAAAIDKEEQRARARTPYVAPNLRLPDEDGVWALDTFRDQPELVALTQNAGGVNREPGHNVLRSTLNPLGGMKQSVQIPGAKSKAQLHVNDPALYVSITGADDNEADSSAVTVETHGAASVKDKNGSSANSQYAIVRVRSNFKKDYRAVSGINIGVTGKVTQTEDVIPTTSQLLPGNRWVKLTPQQPLTIGEYALMEVLGPGEVNLSVWDFRIDPQGPDNKNALIPLQRSSNNDR